MVIICVLAVVNFQAWYNNYESLLFVKLENEGSNEILYSYPELILNNTLYFRNSFKNITINELRINDQNCNFNITSYSTGQKIIPLGNCLENISNSNVFVELFTNEGIISRTLIIKK